MRKVIDPDFLYIVVDRQDVMAGNTRPTLDVLKSLIRSPAYARQWHERVDIAFDGYNETKEELFEIVDVRNFVYQLDEQFPFWFFFLSKSHFGLQCIMLCFLPPFLTPEAEAEIFPERIGRLLENRWFPAMNHVCKFIGMSELEIEQMTNRVIEYIWARVAHVQEGAPADGFGLL
jgi:hypothetical protein